MAKSTTKPIEQAPPEKTVERRTTKNLHPKTLAKDAAALQAAGATGSFRDGDGLVLVVTASGRARFVHEFQWQGKATERWFPGDFPHEISLSKAREIHAADRQMLRDRINPKVAAKIAGLVALGVPTFAAYAKQHAGFLAPESIRARRTWTRQMTGGDTDGLSVGALAAMPIDNIGLAEVKALLMPIWLANPATAKELCGRIRRVIDHRMTNMGDEDKANPADFRRIERAIGKRFKSKHKSHDFLPHHEVPAFLARLADRPQLSARALEMLIATGCRMREITEACWGEIDLRARTFTVPASRMKGQDDEDGEAHVIPLTRAMVRTLRRCIPPTGQPAPTDLIFPNRYGRALDGKDLRAHVLALTAGRTDCKPTCHGFRTSMKNWGTAMAHRRLPVFDRDLMDVCLAHKIGGEVSQAYLRDRWLDRRRAVMREWSIFCLSPPSANVVPFQRRAA